MYYRLDKNVFANKSAVIFPFVDNDEDFSSRDNTDVDINSGKLRIALVKESDAGDYVCVADNGIPPSIISNFTITIHGMK